MFVGVLQLITQFLLLTSDDFHHYLQRHMYYYYRLRSSRLTAERAHYLIAGNTVAITLSVHIIKAQCFFALKLSTDLPTRVLQSRLDGTILQQRVELQYQLLVDIAKQRKKKEKYFHAFS